VVDGGEPGVDSRDEGEQTGRNDLLYVEKMMQIALSDYAPPLATGARPPNLPKTYNTCNTTAIKENRKIDV